MIQKSSIFNKALKTNEIRTVRTLSFQGDDFQEYFPIGDLGFSYLKGMKDISISKETVIQEIYKNRNISIFNNPVNEAKLQKIELEEDELGSIYHWITLNRNERISIEQVAEHIVELLHYYKLGRCLVYDLEIPLGEIVILGHPSSPVKEQTLAEALKGDDYWGDYVEAVTRYVEPSWIKGTFKLKYGNGVLEFHPVMVTRNSVLKSVRKFKYGTNTELFGSIK